MNAILKGVDKAVKVIRQTYNNLVISIQERDKL